MADGGIAFGLPHSDTEGSAPHRWHVHRTPVHASWSNQVELYFSARARAVIPHGDFTSRDDLIDKLDTYVIEKNAVAKPYRGTLRRHPAQGLMTLNELTRHCTSGGLLALAGFRSIRTDREL